MAAGHVNEAGLREYLTAHNWPPGLHNAVLNSLNKLPMRFFVIDDSGSMATSDGHRLVNNKYVNCTRWAELVDSMRFHAGLAQAANALSEFRLLNGAPPCMVGCGDGGDGYRRLMSGLSQSPSGLTPLCKHIREIVAQIQGMETQIRAAGHKVVVVIATDGESSDGDIVQALKPLEHLPVQIVIRLCTDEDKVVNYWNDIDSAIEADIDVLDDLVGEAAEVYEHNKWLTYGEPLHRLREFGIELKEFDLLDEAALNREQIRTVCTVIFGGHVSEYPHPEAEEKAFLKKIHDMNKQLGTVYSPLKKTRRLWIEEANLPGQGCVIM